MKKQVEIEGKIVTFEANAFTPIAYTDMFGEDYMSQSMVWAKQAQGGDVSSVNTTFLMKLAYVMAKEATLNLPEFKKWLSQFSPTAFYSEGVIQTIVELALSNNRTHSVSKKKNDPRNVR